MMEHEKLRELAALIYPSRCPVCGVVIGANDALYGMERRGNTTFIVSSGISGWAIPFKTLCRSEIAVIDVAAPRTDNKD